MKVIYILGAGRSGSTLLDIILGNNESILSCGELRKFEELAGMPSGVDTKSKSAVFWRTIWEQYQIEFGDSELLPCGHHHTDFFPTLLGVVGKSSRIQYQKRVARLYELIAEASGKRILVDSSKYPTRALLLKDLPEIEMSYILLQRGYSSVVRSFQKKGLEQPPKGRVSASVYFWVMYAMSRMAVFVLSERHKVVRVSYEELLSDPVATLEKLEVNLKLDLGEAKTKARMQQSFEVGNLLEGNRIRLKESFSLERS